MWAKSLLQAIGLMLLAVIVVAPLGCRRRSIEEEIERQQARVKADQIKAAAFLNE